MSRILIVDDEANIRDVVQYALEREGFEVEAASDGQQALARLDAGGIDLIVLDVLMPELDGLSLCRRVRERADVPIIFLSSRTEEADRVIGLELGGDDYVTKPFSPRELAARVKAVLRRTGRHDDPGGDPGGDPGAARASGVPPYREGAPVITLGRLTLDPDAHEARVDGAEPVLLTVTEFRVLYAICERPGRVLSRAKLIELAYDDAIYISERTIDSHIKRIRAKLRPFGISPIETIHGLGYKTR